MTLLKTSDLTGDMIRAPANDARPSAIVLPMPAPGAQKFRRDADANEPRGKILLFTGVRYERMPEPEAEPADDSTLPKRKRS